MCPAAGKCLLECLTKQTGENIGKIVGGKDGADDERDGGHDLDEDVEAGADGVLERVAHGVADDGGVVLGAALASTFDRARFDGLFAVVPGAAGVAR